MSSKRNRITPCKLFERSMVRHSPEFLKILHAQIDLDAEDAEIP